MPICTRKTLRVFLDPGHKMGPWSTANEHGVSSAVCKGCGGIAVEHPGGRVDPERHLLSMSCERARLIAHIADRAVGVK